MLRPFALFLFLSLPALCQESPRLEFAKGLLDQSNGKITEAAQRFEAARLADPLALPLVERAAQRRLAEGNLASAVTLYRDLATAQPARLDAQLTYADFLRNQGGGDGLAEKIAGEALENALHQFPGSLAILRRLFLNSEARTDHKRSLSLFDSLVASPPLSPATMLMAEEWSRLLFPAAEKSALARLDALFVSSVQAFPRDPDLARAASEHFRKTKRLDQAIAILQTHAAAVPYDLELRTRLGILQLSADQTAAGEATLNDVLVIDSRRVLAHESLAKLYRQQEKPALARPHADAVLKIRGGDPSEFIALADEWLAAEQPKLARILLEKARYDHPNDPAIAAKLAIASRRDPETRSLSSRLFRAAEALIPTDAKPEPTFLAESAEALIDEQRLPAAEEHLRKAIKAFPPDAKKDTALTLRRLAGLWESQGKNADAAHALRQRADAMDPK
jgi:tetratricopeptide (TPR) repeat protein